MPGVEGIECSGGCISGLAELGCIINLMSKWDSNNDDGGSDAWGKSSSNGSSNAWGNKPSSNSNGNESSGDAWGSKPSNGGGGGGGGGNAWGGSSRPSDSGAPRREGGGGGGGGGGSRSKFEVFIRGLPFKANAEEIEDFLRESLENADYVNVLKKEDGTPKGSAFVKFADEQSMLNAVEKTGLEFMGRKLTIELTRAAQEARGGGGGGSSNNGGGGGGGFNRGGNDAWGGGGGGFSGNNDRERSREQDRGGYNGGGGGGGGGGRDNTKTVFVGNLSYNSDESSIRSFFESCGAVKDVRVAMRPDGKSKGFAHVEFEDEKGAQAACKKNNSDLDGRRVKVDIAGNKRD